MRKYNVSLGSGVILAIDSSHCAVDIALNTMEFSGTNRVVSVRHAEKAQG